MIFINAFLIGGLICTIGQIILDNTNLTYGHLNSLFVIIGVFLSFIGVYDVLLNYSEVGSSIMITNFGNLLYEGAIVGFKENGIFGLLTNIFSYTSAGLAVTIIMSFLVAIISKPKN